MRTGLCIISMVLIDKLLNPKFWTSGHKTGLILGVTLWFVLGAMEDVKDLRRK